MIPAAKKKQPKKPRVLVSKHDVTSANFKKADVEEQKAVELIPEPKAGKPAYREMRRGSGVDLSDFAVAKAPDAPVTFASFGALVDNAGFQYLHFEATKETADKLLLADKGKNVSGKYLFRQKQPIGQNVNREFTLSVVFRSKVTHHIITTRPDGLLAVNGGETPCDTLEELVSFLGSKQKSIKWPVPLTMGVALPLEAQLTVAKEAADNAAALAADDALEASNATVAAEEAATKREEQEAEQGEALGGFKTTAPAVEVVEFEGTAEEHAAAATIQAGFRGHKVRKETAARPLLEPEPEPEPDPVSTLAVDEEVVEFEGTAEEHAAAAKIQAGFRGHKVRKDTAARPQLRAGGEGGGDAAATLAPLPAGTAAAKETVNRNSVLFDSAAYTLCPFLHGECAKTQAEQLLFDDGGNAVNGKFLFRTTKGLANVEPDKAILSVVYKKKVTHHSVTRVDGKFAINNNVSECSTLTELAEFCKTKQKSIKWPVPLVHGVVAEFQ